MSEHAITIDGGTSKRLLTAGKYCDRDIVVKAMGADGVGTLSKYAKFIAKPESAASFTITNPLGGFARKVFVRRTVNTQTSSRKAQIYIADSEYGMGCAYYTATDGGARYVVNAVSSGLGNGDFMITDGKIQLYRFNSANTWDDNSEYEVEIYE